MHKFFLILVVLFVFTAGFFVAKETLTRIYSDIRSQEPFISTSVMNAGNCDAACQKTIDDQVSKAFATISGSLNRTSVPTATAAPSHQVQFITLGGTFTTSSLDWVNVPGTDVTFDISKNYPPNSIVTWQAALSVANPNEKASARLFDTTHGIGINGSEISVAGSTSFQTVYSGNLNLWSGNINYIVQIKSLNSFPVSYSGGKIKIVY